MVQAYQRLIKGCEMDRWRTRERKIEEGEE